MNADDIARMVAAVNAMGVAVSQLRVAVTVLAESAAAEVAAFAEFAAFEREVAEEFGDASMRRGTVIAMPSRGEPSPPAA